MQYAPADPERGPHTRQFNLDKALLRMLYQTDAAGEIKAVLALEKAQQEFDGSRHRAVVVLNPAGKVVGKICQMDVLRTLEPKYQEMQGSQGMAHLGFTRRKKTAVPLPSESKSGIPCFS